MRFSWLTQLGFDFDTPAARPSAGASTSVAASVAASEAASAAAAGLMGGAGTRTPEPVAPVGAAPSTMGVLPIAPLPVVAPLPMLFAEPTRPPQAPEFNRDRPSRGRTATRARTAVLFSRLQELGLRGVEALVLIRTRTVMVSLIGRTLRVHEGYADAPEPVLQAIITFAMARHKAARAVAKEAILSHDVERAPAIRRVEPARPGDLAIIAQLCEAHRALNAQWFDGALGVLPIRLSGRMATRLGHFDPGSRHTPSEIVMSRTHVVRHGWREAMHTLLHEMVHQWQHETGTTVDHGPGFRAKCREVGITPAARRDVTPLERKHRATG